MLGCVAVLSLLQSCDTAEQQLPSDHRLYKLSPERIGEPTVEVRKTADGYQLFRHGKPYFIKGACGTTNLEMLKAAGGNSIRTYTTLELDTLLDKAHSLDITVMAGLWVGLQKEGFDYEDETSVKRQKEEIAAIVNRYKHHPALLAWAVGNETMVHAWDYDKLWPVLNDLVDLVQQLDPDHPVTIVEELANSLQLAPKCPNIDFLAVNTSGNIHYLHKIVNPDMPFIISEWTNTGYWEKLHNSWGAAGEDPISIKYWQLKNNYYNYIHPNRPNCLGSYVFFWGYKYEHTHTWFSMFTPQGEKTALVDLMFEFWSGKVPSNMAPFLDSLAIEGLDMEAEVFVNAGRSMWVSARACDPDGDPLLYRWEIVPEGYSGEFSAENSCFASPCPQMIPSDPGRPRLQVVAPGKPGPYRLYVYATDGHGNAAYAGTPFFVINNNLSE